MKKFTVSVYGTLVAALSFSVMNISFHADISLLAFPLSAAFTAFLFYTAVGPLLKGNRIEKIAVVRKMYQYLPFVFLTVFVLRRAGKKGTVYAFDVISVILWIITAVGTIIVLYYLNEKRVYNLFPIWKKQHENQTPIVRHGWGRVVFEIIDWVDALVWAVFMVLLIQIFIVQLYEIPSESMVPEFLVKDRVGVLKTPSGPKFPLSDIGIPCMRSYKRGDIVIFRNPHYRIDRKSEVKTVVSQLVYMLTFSGVNLNTDEITGKPKADPLVKRVTGVPGEQLMMQDGTLYARTKKSGKFVPVTSDNDWAAWNLNSTRSDIKSKIQYYPLSEDDYESMIACEKERRSLDIDQTKEECRALAKQFAILAGKQQRSTADVSALFTQQQMFVYYLMNNDTNNTDNNISVTQKLLSADGGSEWFTAFMTDWIGKNAVYTDTQNEITGDRLVGGNLYSDANFKLNLMIKLVFGRLVVRNAKLMTVDKDSVAEMNSDNTRRQILEKASVLFDYVMHLDQRNMPEFPSNDAQGNPQYIPARHYFMMGDNRFNSLDMRHSYDSRIVKLTPLDSYSVTYYSDMEPQYVDCSLILGTALFRFWPISRIGIPGHTGKIDQKG